ncbi:MAG TPA: hypothetical protein PK411_11685 [Mesotoga infera]|nr:hypothetical protein [Mesotoga infera]HRV02418.1 hypothetical protein [Mesotoga sp.]
MLARDMQRPRARLSFLPKRSAIEPVGTSIASELTWNMPSSNPICVRLIPLKAI